MMIILLILFIQGLAAFDEDMTRMSGICKMQGYNFIGMYLSDNYQLPNIKGITACQVRNSLDPGKFTDELISNNQLILQKINKVLKNPECIESHKVVSDHIITLGKEQIYFKQKSKFRHDLLKAHLVGSDVQRVNSFMSAYSVACSSEEYRRAAIIDLEFLNNVSGITAKYEESFELKAGCDMITTNFGTPSSTILVAPMDEVNGQEFEFFYSVFHNPDRMKLINFNKEVLFDSGCVSGDKRMNENSIKIPTEKLGPEKKLIIQIDNNCNKEKSPERNWVFGLTCNPQQKLKIEALSVCSEAKDLINLVKKEIEIIKVLSDIKSSEYECYVHYDKNILENFYKDAGIVYPESDWINGMCPIQDHDCYQKRVSRINKENKALFEIPDQGNLERVSLEKKLNVNEKDKKFFKDNCGDIKQSKTNPSSHKGWDYCNYHIKQIGFE